MHKLLLGIEHLMTGVSLAVLDNRLITFQPESSSIVAALCAKPFAAYWPVNHTFLHSVEYDAVAKGPGSQGAAEWYAHVMASVMQEAEHRSYCMQTYRRVGRKLDDGEPPFTEAVVKAMRAKFGKDSDHWLAELRWSRDHWFFTKDRMYHGVEPDGYIHT